MLFVAACGAPAATDGGDGDDGGDGSEQTEPAETSGDGGGGGGGSGSGDVDRAFEILTPPSSTELTKTTTGGVIFAAFDSSESFESLRSFYEDAIDEAGLQILSTSETGGGIAWAIAEGEGSTFGGAVTIFPAADGSGMQVSVTIGNAE